MKLTVDHGADALYLHVADNGIVDSEQIAPGIVVDYDIHHRIVGIELLHLSQRAPEADLQRLLFETLAVSG